MDYHKLLQKQIKRHLAADWVENPKFIAFIQSVNDSYLAFERDKEITSNSFKENEKEYHEINNRFKQEIKLKRLAANNLYKSINKDDLDYDINFDHNDDLLFVSDYLTAQIEKRKETEVALLKNMKELEDYKSALDQSAIITITDEKGIIKTVNDNFCEISQFSREELIGKTNRIINSKFHSKSFFKEMWQTITEGNIWTGLIKIKAKNGEFFWVDTTIVPFLDLDKKPFQFLAVSYDITEIKNAEAEVIKAKEIAERSEEHNRIIMNSSLNSIVTIDGSKNITFWNPQAEAVFGWKREEVIGKPMIDLLIPARYRLIWNTIIDNYDENEANPHLNTLLELKLLNHSGNEFVGEVSIIPIVQNNENYFCAFVQDISKRNKAQNQLRESAELMKTLLANLRAGILVEDQNRKILFTNQLFCDFFSIPALPEEMIGIDCTYSAEQSRGLFKDQERFVSRINSILSERKTVTVELLETVDNKFFERDYIPIFIDNEYKGHLWKYTDVTERILNQKLLEQSEQRNSLIMNSSLNAIVNVDNDGKITFWNHQATLIFGWEIEEILGKQLVETILPHQNKDIYDVVHRNRIRKIENSALKKHIELIGIKQNGEELIIDCSIIPINQNEGIFYCLFIQDITEKKEAENLRKIQEEKYQKVIAHMNLGLLEIDNNEVIQYANQSFATMSGYEINELIGKKSSELLIYGDNLEIVKSKNELRKQGASDIYQIQNRNRQGELRWWAISGAPNYDNRGNVIGSIGIHLDITDQKQLELDLEKEKTNAIESSKAKEVFLANMSHEIRTPLNAIIGFLRELDKQEFTELNKKYIDNSAIASKHLLSIINNILDISKIEAGEMSLESEDFVFEKSISNVATVLQPLLEQKGLELNISLSNTIEKVLKGDTLRLQQILFNLIGNAIKFTSKGGISINCEVLENNLDSQELKISITDTGIGMDSSYMGTIFNKFSQEDKAVTRKYGGTGLGLSITNELVKLMNGRIEIESEKNVGTTFHIFINFLKGSLQAIENEHSEAPVSNIDNISILLVEDNFLNRMVAQNSLQYYNCNVIEAENGVEAIEILKNETFDVILMDIQMPEMGGIEATVIIRNELNLTTPIIALTANAFKTEIDRCRKAGMDDYVTKPFDEEILIETIAKHTTNKKTVIPQTIVNQELPKSDTLYNLSSLFKLSRGNREFIDKMINVFIEQAKDTIEKVTIAISKEDYLEVSRLIHKIKPSIENLGIESIFNELKLLEKNLKETNDKEQIAVQFNTIKEVLENVQIQLKENELNY